MSATGQTTTTTTTTGRTVIEINDEYYSKSGFLFESDGVDIKYQCKSMMTDDKGKPMLDPNTKQPKFQFDLSDPFKCPFAPDAKCIFADKIFNEDTYSTLDLLDGMAEAQNNSLKMKQKYVSCVNSDTDGNVIISNTTNPTTVKVFEYTISVPHHKDPTTIDKRTYIVNPSQCGLMNFSEMINTTTIDDIPTLNRNYFTSSKGNKPMFTDVTDDYLYTELNIINVNDQANGKAYSDICTRATGSRPAAEYKVTTEVPLGGL